MQKFFFSIVLPSLLAITLFIIAIYVLILPSFQEQMMERKKEMIKELTQSAVSLADSYNKKHEDGEISLESAQKIAAQQIGSLRYGQEQKDYFWITDMNPVMIMHPYRPELINTDLTNYQDSEGKRLFVEAVRTVELREHGYIDYMWQWKDDSSMIVPKLSYVQSYNSWGWIIGTGIYLEDVKAEIIALERKLILTSLIITLIILISLIFIIRQSLVIERSRQKAEKQLRQSEQKYKSLVEASTEGTLMLVNKQIVFVNQKFRNLIGEEDENSQMTFDELFSVSVDEIIESFDIPGKSVSREARLLCIDKTEKDVVISASRVNKPEENAIIVIVKELGWSKKTEKQMIQLQDELQVSLLMMNRNIKPLIRDAFHCTLETNIQDAAELMSRKKESAILVKHDDTYIGIISDTDIRNRLVAEGLDPKDTSVSAIMSAPLIKIGEGATLYEANMLFQKYGVRHLAVVKKSGKKLGIIREKDVLDMHRNSIGLLINGCQTSETLTELEDIHGRVPALIQSLLESGGNAQAISRMITKLNDALTYRVIELALEESGESPYPFSFMNMGSEGRMEQTFYTDQDNAMIIHHKGELTEDTKAWFESFSHKVNTMLAQLGFPLCEGEIMIRNPLWRVNLDGWKKHFRQWIEESEPEAILNANIFFDFRTTYGDDEAVEKLRQFIFETAKEKPGFFFHMAYSVVNFKPPKRIPDESFDAKLLLIPIISYIRLLSIKHGISYTNTLDRLQALKEVQVLNENQARELAYTYNFLMILRFRFQSEAIINGRIPDNMIDGSKISAIEQSTLKRIFTMISELQSKVEMEYRIS